MVKRLHIGVGPRRQRRNPPFPSEPDYIVFMRESAKAMTDAMLDVLDQFEDVSEDIMLEVLEPTFEKAKYYTPKDTMELVESAYLEKASFRGKPRVEMGFAKGGKPVYAVYVHEILEYKHEEPTQAKFLEYALYESLDDIYVQLGASYRRFMGGR